MTACSVVLCVLATLTAQFYFARSFKLRRWRQILFIAEHTEQRTFFYSILFILVNIHINAFLVVSTECCFLLLTQHVCGMFRVVGYHLRNACGENILKTPANQRFCTVRSKISHAMRVHVKAIKFMDAMWDQFSISYCGVVLISMVLASVNMTCLFDALKSMDILEVLISFIYVVFIAIYGFCTTYFGQELMDHGRRLFDDAYESSWYEVPIEAQKLYLFILQRNLKDRSFSKSGFFSSSLEGLTQLASATFSYFTLLCSVQK